MDVEQYLSLITKGLKANYRNSNFSKLASLSIDDLGFLYNVLVLEFLKNNLKFDGEENETNSAPRGKVIDIT